MSDNTTNLRILARRAFETGDYTGAGSYYRQILLSKPNDWESMFYEAYCSMADFSVASISTNAQRLNLIFEQTYKKFLMDMALKKTKDPSFDMTVPMKQLSRDMTTLLLAMQRSAIDFHNKFSDTAAETKERLHALGRAALGIGDVYYFNQHKAMAANFYKLAQTLMNGAYNIGETAIQRIREVDPSYSLPGQKEPTTNTDMKSFLKTFFKWFGILFGIPYLCWLIYTICNQ